MKHFFPHFFWDFFFDFFDFFFDAFFAFFFDDFDFEEVGVEVPVVVRLEGNNADKGRQVLADSGLNIIAATGLADAAQKVVNAAEGK